MKTPTLDEIRSAKHQAEAEILHALERLRERTGLCPFGIDVYRMDCIKLCSPRPEYLLTGVRIDMEGI